MDNNPSKPKAVNIQNSRLTKQRKTILECALNTQTHFDTEQIYEIVKKKLPSIGLGTVYRNLHYLVKNNFISGPVHINHKHYFSNISKKQHLHFYCKNCLKVADIKIGDDFYKKHNKYLGKIEKIECSIYGICRDCLLKAKKNNLL